MYNEEVHFPSNYHQGGIIQTTITRGEEKLSDIKLNVKKSVYIPSELDNLRQEANELSRLFNSVPPLPSFLRDEYRQRLLQVQRQIALLEVEQLKTQLIYEQEQYQNVLAELPTLVKAEADAHAALNVAEQVHDNTAALLDNAHGRGRNHSIRIGELNRKLDEHAYLIQGEQS